jgi:hypothetical protein
MRVIGAGFGRTGTLSLRAALERLGIAPCYHAFEFIAHPEHAPLWDRAARGQAVDWTRELALYEATVDWPGCAFYRDLMEAFPAAPVILSVRDPDRWYESAASTIYPLSREAPALIGAPDGPPPEMAGVADAMWRIVFGGTFAGRFEDREYAIEVFNRHNEEVRATVPADRLLVHEVGQGWGPLCNFLGTPVPDEPFPRINDRGIFRDLIEAQARGQSPLD